MVAHRIDGILIATRSRPVRHIWRGEPARIVFKLNALVDEAIIDALYDASQAGVYVDIIGRGICALRPGIAGLSDNIRVRSIVGRFLEHSRIYYFANGGDEQIYIGSADWMARNLYERVEVLVPLQDELLRERAHHEILDAYLADNRKARILLPDGNYIRAWQPLRGTRNRKAPVGAAAFNAQEFLIQLAEGKQPALSPANLLSGKRKILVGKER